MREILFRGKRTDNGEWVEGYLVNKHDPLLGTAHTFILVQEMDCSCITGEPTVLKSEMSWFEVVPETVGQYTGLTDKNGTKIFEGDIVRFRWDAECEYCHIIEFVDGEFCATPVLPLENTWQIRICGENKKFTVIGTIHDNPELLENGGDSQ